MKISLLTGSIPSNISLQRIAAGDR